MKRAQLYHLIDEIIQKNKQQKLKKTQKQSRSVCSYYNQFLRKNKLSPSGKKQKMKNILQKFSNVDSYIDLNDVISEIYKHIYQQIKKEQKQVKAQSQNKKKQKIKTQPKQNISKHSHTIQKVEKLFKNKYKQGLYFELNNCSEIVRNLQQNSNQLNNVKYKNCSSHLTYHQLLNKKHIEKKSYYFDQKLNINNSHLSKNDESSEPLGQNNKLSKMSIWKMLRNPRNGQLRLNKNYQKQQIELEFFHLNNLKKLNSVKDKRNRFDQLKMLHSAAIYLHMILQKEHQKKWELQRFKVNKQNLIVNEKKTQKNQRTVKLNIHNTYQQQNKGSKDRQKRHQNNQYNVKSEKNLYDKNYLFTNESKIKDNNNEPFRKSNLSILNNKKSYKYLKQHKINEKKIDQTSSYMNDSSAINQATYSSIGKSNQADQNSSIKRTSLKSILDKNMSYQNKLRAQKKPRYTLQHSQNFYQIKQFPKQQTQIRNDRRQMSKKQIKERFTFKKRKLKQKVLRKITQFVNDVEYAQRNMIVQSKKYQRQLQNIQQKMKSDYQNFKSQKLLNDEKVLEGVRCALTKHRSGYKRYQN